MSHGSRYTAPMVLALAERVDLDTLGWVVGDEDEPDRPFYEQLLRGTSGPILEAGCGTGRLLLALIRAGFSVEGCDISPTMLSFCRTHAERAGFAPPLYSCAIQELPFVERYSAILLACGTFMCVTDHDEVDRCLRTLRANLVAGGQLIVSLMPATYLHLAGGPFPTPWEPYYELVLPGGTGTLVVDWRTTGMCPIQQIVDEECRYRWMAGEVVRREETSAGRHRWYRREQFAERLRRAGFADITVYANYSTRPEEPDSVLSFVARRPN